MSRLRGGTIGTRPAGVSDESDGRERTRGGCERARRHASTRWPVVDRHAWTAAPVDALTKATNQSA